MDYAIEWAFADLTTGGITFDLGKIIDLRLAFKDDTPSLIQPTGPHDPHTGPYQPAKLVLNLRASKYIKIRGVDLQLHVNYAAYRGVSSHILIYAAPEAYKFKIYGYDDMFGTAGWIKIWEVRVNPHNGFLIRNRLLHHRGWIQGDVPRRKTHFYGM